jgi:sulfate adenylyltransferase
MTMGLSDENKGISSRVVSLPAHGGCGLIERFLSEEKRKSCLDNALNFKSYTITNSDLSTFFRIADGTLSPIEGPMDGAEFYGVLDNEFIERKGKKYAWAIPIAFPISKKDGEDLKAGETVLVKDERGVEVGILEISDIYYFDKEKYNRIVYGTTRADHPGPRIINEDPRDYLLGGRIWAFTEFRHPTYARYILSPGECRSLFKTKSWDRIIAFQTRNPLHRAHEYAMVYSMEHITKEGFFAGAVLNPLIGETKSDDIPADVRMKTYEVLIENRLLGKGDKDAAMWQTRGYDLNDQLLLIGLDIKMFYAGPKEAVMHAIYRQNLGFTDIIIGRKHADAPFDDGTPAWGDFEAQNKFDELKGELLIKPFKVGFAAYFKELGRVGLVDEYKDKGYSEIKISGKELREKLQRGESIDDRIMRKEVAKILSDSYRHNIAQLRTGIKSKNITWHESGLSKQMREETCGHKAACIWLTGLSCAGKSTLAGELQNELFKLGCQVFILDGDNIRHGLNKDLGFSPEDRTENIRRIGEVAKLFVEAGSLVITAFISPYRADRDLVRSIFSGGDFIEVFIKASLSTCEKRDTKGLYKKARRGEIKEFTGISAPYEIPERPELTIDTENHTKEEACKAS